MKPKPAIDTLTIQPTHAQTNRAGNVNQSLPNALVEKSVLKLVSRLCQALLEEDIDYCHWKSNNALDRSASGDNDLDLLVSRSDSEGFCEILSRLGFKQAKAPPEKQLPAAVDYFGYDQPADKWVHVHVHYQLILGHDMTKNYRLPVEKAYLASADQGGVFKTPQVEFEYVVLVVRMILKYATWDAILGRQGKLKISERNELAYLQERIDLQHVTAILKQHLSYIDLDLFASCVRALQPGCPVWQRVQAAHRLLGVLQANAERSWLADTTTKLWRRCVLALRRRIIRSETNYRPVTGGACIAIVGCDGSGKSTAIEGLHSWLVGTFDVTRVHMGKPAWSPLTIAIRSLLKVGQLLNLYPEVSPMRATLAQKSKISPGYPWLIREVCTARDRYHTYLKARRFAAKGGIVLLDRLPLPQIRMMDGPRTEQFLDALARQPQSKQLLRPRKDSFLTRFLVRLEQSYYQRMVLPELLIVLRIDPEIAVKRKTEDDEAVIRERAIEIWQTDWNGTYAHLIDASKSKGEVLSIMKSLILSEL